VLPGGAGYRLTCRSAEVVTAACGPAWPCICVVGSQSGSRNLVSGANFREPGPDAIADRASNHRPHLKEREAAETYQRHGSNPTKPDLISTAVSAQKAVSIRRAEVTLLPARPARCGEAEIEWRGQADLLAVGAVGRHLIPLPAFG
jgi:hypothetical protein